MPEKPAPTDHPIHELLARRWSGRAFGDRPLDDATLCSLFEAARWAPSSGNGQPWSFLYAKREDADGFAKFTGLLAPGNLTWAPRAGALLLSVAQLDREPGKPNRHAMHDVGLACENLALQAFAMGLVVHMMAGFDAARSRVVFEIPEQWEPVAMIAVGWPGDGSNLNEELKARETAPRQRKPISEFVFSGKWGQAGGLK